MTMQRLRVLTETSLDAWRDRNVVILTLNRRGALVAQVWDPEFHFLVRERPLDDPRELPYEPQNLEAKSTAANPQAVRVAAPGDDVLPSPELARDPDGVASPRRPRERGDVGG